MFLDESGDHDLARIDPQYPIFVLGGVILRQDYAETTLEEAVRRLKLDVFGRDDLLLHTADIARNRNGFESLKDGAVRGRFYDALKQVVVEADFKVVACAIKKVEHLARHGERAIDPYCYCLEVLVERFCFEVGRFSRGEVIAERRNPILDKQLTLSWESLRSRGTSYLKGAVVRERLGDLVLRNKSESCAAAELADLVVSPIGRFVLGKPIKDDYRIIERKYRTHRGRCEGAGLIVLPRSNAKGRDQAET